MKHLVQKIPRGSALLLVLLAGLMAACDTGGTLTPQPNDDTKGKDPVELTCNRGVVSADGKSCESATNCEGDSKKCLEGNSCDANNQCVPSVCGEGKPDCERGECSDGLCVSKATCQAGDPDKSCIDGDVCIDRKCTKLKTCHAVGTCSGPSDKECVLMKEVCVEESPCANTDDCRSMNFCDPTNTQCAENKCLTDTGEKDCTATGGGVCNKKTGDCENAPVCTKASECIDNADLTLKKICVANPADTSLTDKQCLTFSDICNETCRDVSNCEYKTDTLEMVCNNGGACSDITDCKKNEYCDGTTCQAIDAYSCDKDRLEDNNDKDHASDFLKNKKKNQIDGLTLCKGDVDYFVIDNVAKYNKPGTSFIIDVNYDENSKGRKVDAKLTVEFVKVDSSSGAESIIDQPLEAKSFRQDSGDPAEVYHDGIHFYVDASSKTDLSKIYFKVEHNSTDNPLGIGYSLNVRAVEVTLQDMCATATELTFNDVAGEKVAKLTAQDLNASTDSGVSFPQYPDCRDDTGNIKELAYSFKVEGTKAKKVSVKVTPSATSDFDPVLVLLKGCELGELDTNPEHKTACVQNADKNNIESYDSLLEPGTYTAVVTAKDDQTVGTGVFDLEVKQSDTTCDLLNDQSCNGTKKIVCDAFLESVLPEADCAPATCVDYKEGRVGCAYDFGSFCSNPHIVTKDMPLAGLTADTSKMLNQTTKSTYDCDGKLSANAVSGGEVYVMAEVPAGHTAYISARAPKDNGTAAGLFSIYATKSCALDSCEGATPFSPVLSRPTYLSYTNTTGSDEVIYFVVESVKPLNKYYKNDVIIDAKVVETTSLTCIPGAKSCDTTTSTDQKLVVCELDENGVPQEVARSCGTGNACDDSGAEAFCEAGGETCDKPIEPVLGEWTYYSTADYPTDNYAPPKGCPDQDGNPLSSWIDGGSEVLYKIKANKGDFIRVTLVTDTSYLFWETSKCPILGDSCEHASDHFNAVDPGEDKVALFAATGDPQYFVMERKANYGDLKNFRIKFEVLQGNCDKLLAKPTCDANTGIVTYCDGLNTLNKVQCVGGCQSDPARCTTYPDEEKGANCAKPIIGNSGSTMSGTDTQKLKNSSYKGVGVNGVLLQSGLNGECSLEVESDSAKVETTSGLDLVYAFELQPNEVLKYRIKVASSGYGASANYDKFRVFLLNESCSRSGCMNMRDRHFVNTSTGDYYEETPGVPYYFTYYSRAAASTIETVYLVIDTTDLSYQETDVTLDWKIESVSGPVLNPGYTVCSGASGNDVKFHTLDGAETTATCPDGTKCLNGACQPVKDAVTNTIVGDVCDDAQIKTHGAPGAFVVESGDAKSHMSLTNDAAPTCGSVGLQSNGDDYFFKVVVPSHQMLVVNGRSGGFGYPTVYIGESCTKLKVDNDCISSAQGGEQYNLSSDHAIAEYYNATTSDKTVVVGLDSAKLVSGDINDVFYYTVDFIQMPSCTTPNEVSCITQGGSSKMVNCRMGQYVDIPGGACPAGCNSSGKECDLPGESIAQARTLTPTTSQQTTPVNTSLGKSTDTSTILARTYAGDDSLVYGSCPFAAKPIGPDQYYKVTLAAGDLFEAKLKQATSYTGSTPQRGFQFYLVAADGKTCITLSQAASPDNSLTTEPLELKFQAFVGGDYYLVVDNQNATITSADAQFEIDYKVTKKPSDCVEMMTECKSDTQLYICDNPGNAPTTVDCPYGCVGGACRASSATGSYDTCQASDTDMPLPTVLIYDTNASDLTLNYDIQTKGPCWLLDANTKNDLVAKVSLAANEFIDIKDVRSNYKFQPAYYVVKAPSCVAATYACEDGRVGEPGVSSDPSTKVRHTMLTKASYSSNKSVYLGVTAKEVSTFADAALVYISKGQIQCNMATPVTCDPLTNSIKYCASPGLPQQTYHCAPGKTCNGTHFCQAADTKPGNDPFAPIDLDDPSVATWTTTITNLKRADVNGQTTIGYDNNFGTAGFGVNLPGVCSNKFVFSSGGADVFYKITLKPGERLVAEILKTTSDHRSVQTYLYKAGSKYLIPVNHSGQYPACLAGAGGYGPKILDYRLPKTSPETQFIFAVDSYIPPEGDFNFDMEIRIHPPIP